jgi:hypothetical protein
MKTPDDAIAIAHRVLTYENFDDTARILLRLLNNAHRKFPQSAGPWQRETPYLCQSVLVCLANRRETLRVPANPHGRVRRSPDLRYFFIEMPPFGALQEREMRRLFTGEL